MNIPAKMSLPYQYRTHPNYKTVFVPPVRLFDTVKHELKQHYSDNREAYTSGKHEFIAGVLQRLNKDGI